MRIFRPKFKPKKKLTAAQKATLRATHISLLHSKGYSLDLLNGKTDKYLWQMCNRYGPQNLSSMMFGKIQRPRSVL